jgi:sugar phosphate permease
VVGFGVGALFSLGVFLEPIQRSTGWSRGAISGVALSMWVAYGSGSLLWGLLADRVGARAVVIAGGFLLGVGLVAPLTRWLIGAWDWRGDAGSRRPRVE